MFNSETINFVRQYVSDIQKPREYVAPIVYQETRYTKDGFDAHKEKPKLVVINFETPYDRSGQKACFIVGNPGSGKSMLLDSLFLSEVDFFLKNERERIYVPYHIKLNTFINENITFEEFIKEGLEKTCVAEMIGLAYYRNFIFFLDALDEVPNYNQRKVIDWLQKNAGDLCYFLSLREDLYNYLSVIAGGSFASILQNSLTLSIKEWDYNGISKQVLELARNDESEANKIMNCICGNREGNFYKTVNELWEKFNDPKNNQGEYFWNKKLACGENCAYIPDYIFTNSKLFGAWRTIHRKGLLSLARNPFVLSMIFRAYYLSENGDKPYRNKEQVFGEAILSMLKSSCDNEEYINKVEKILSLIANKIQQGILKIYQECQKINDVQISINISLDDILTLARINDDSSFRDYNTLKIDRLLQIAKNARLISICENIITFSHELLFGYFLNNYTKIYVDKNSYTEDVFEKIIPVCENWAELSLLYAQKYSALKAIECIFSSNHGDLLNINVSVGNNEISLQDELEKIIRNNLSKSDIKIEDRSQLFKALGMIKCDYRSGVLKNEEFPDIAWKEIVPQTVRIGGDKLALRYVEETEIRQLGRYHISQYPITNAQFSCFVKDGGYKTPKYWGDVGKQWKDDFKRVCPTKWNDFCWNIDNLPVVGVSWYEAIAFCNWMTSKLENNGKNILVRLPYEIEWEIAASGDEKREFPWGNEEKPENLNINKQLSPKSTYNESGRSECLLAPVGIYLNNISQYGVRDMSGNIWEWCMDDWSNRYQVSNRISTREQLEKLIRLQEQAQRKVIKGGTFDKGINFSRNGSRLFYPAELAGYQYGFRICLVEEEDV